MPKSLYRSAFSAGDVSPSDVLAFHQRAFGGFVMENDDDAGDGGDSGDQGDDNATGGDGDDDDGSGLGEAGKKALAQERDARKSAEKRASAMEAKVTALIDGLKTGLGVEAAGSDDPADLIAGLRTEIDGLKHTTLVDTVARRHGITDETDLEFLRSAKDRDAMNALAKRLAPAADKDDDSDDAADKDKGKKKPASPRPDPSQGKGGGGSGARPTSVAQVIEDRRAAREKASK